MMKRAYIFAALAALMCVCLLGSCSSDEPKTPASQAEISFSFEPSQSFLDYFTMLAYYKTPDGKDQIRGVEHSPFTAELAYKSLPAQASIQFQFIRNNRPAPNEPVKFSFVLTKSVTVTSTGMPERQHRAETYDITVSPAEFESWAQTMTGRNYSYTLSVDRTGVVKF